MKDWELILQKTASDFKLDIDLMRAIIQIESSGRIFCFKYEPNYRWLYHPSQYAIDLGIPYDYETNMQKTSWGLGQVMGSICREYGHKGNLMEVLEPSKNLFYMATHLKKFLNKYGNESDVIAAYNAGSARKVASGSYENQTYFDKVSAELRKLRSK